MASGFDLCAAFELPEREAPAAASEVSPFGLDHWEKAQQPLPSGDLPAGEDVQSTGPRDYRAGVRDAIAGYKPKPNPYSHSEKKGTKVIVDDRGHVHAAPSTVPTKTDFNSHARDLFKSEGLKFERVDHYDAAQKRQHDLMGVFDYLTFGGGVTTGVQITSRDSMSTRRQKILASYGYQYAKLGGWQVRLIGFFKAQGRWEAKSELL